MDNRLEVLMPTYNKTNDEVFKLVHDLHILDSATISNQNNEEGIIIKDKITIIINKTRGVSINRNPLLKYLSVDYGLFIDDDCVLCDNYGKIILLEFDRHRGAEAIVFSRTSLDQMFKSIKLKNQRIKRFYQISKIGAPDIVIKNDSIQKYNLIFNEKLGAPYNFFNGEDSLFLYELIKKKVNVYSSSISIYTPQPSLDKLSYFVEYPVHLFEAVGGCNTYYISVHIVFIALNKLYIMLLKHV